MPIAIQVHNSKYYKLPQSPEFSDWAFCGRRKFPNVTAEAIDVPKKVEDVGWVLKDWKEFYWFSAFHLFFNLIYACVPTYMYVAIFILPVIITPTLLL